MKTNWIYGTLSGFALCLVSSSCGLLAYCNLSGQVFTGLFLILLLIGVCITVVAVNHGKPTTSHAILRALILFLSCGVFLTVCGSIGILRSLMEYLNATVGGGTDGASGLMMLTLWAVSLIASIAAIAGRAMNKLLQKR